jgi:hypothetical protein
LKSPASRRGSSSSRYIAEASYVWFTRCPYKALKQVFFLEANLYVVSQYTNTVAYVSLLFANRLCWVFHVLHVWQLTCWALIP